METILSVLLNHPSVIVTSRPTGADLEYIDLRLETIGFGRKDVWAFLELKDVVASEEESTAIKQWIERNLFVQEVVNVPIQLDALCYSWDEIKRRQQTDDSFTMTTLYQAMIHKLWRKDILRLEKQDQGIVLTEKMVHEIRLPRRLERAVQPEIDLLDALAFERFQAGQIEFNNREIDHVIEQLEISGVPLPLTLENNLTKLSVLHTNDRNTTGNQRSYSFMHLTFQEFYAAQWLVKQVARNPSLLENCVRQHKYNPRYEIFWRFVAGLLPSGNALNSFFELLNQEPQDLLGIQHQHLIIHLLNESGHHLDPKWRQTLESQLTEWFVFGTKIEKNALLEGGWASWAFPEVQILQLLEDKSRPYSAAVSAMRYLSRHPSLPTRTLNRLVSLLNDDNEMARNCATMVLQRQTNLPKEAIDSLTAFLNDDDTVARQCAARALDGQTNLPKEAIDGLVALLENDSKARDAAARALGRQKNLPKETIDGLLALLEENDSKMRDAATMVLGLQTNLPEEAIDCLVTLLKASEALEARDAATSVLGRQTNLPNKAINSLVALLKENDSKARDAAARALGWQKNLPKEAIDGLVALLQENDSKARDAAARALGRQTNLPKEAIDGLVALLQADDWLVQESAIEALGEHTNLPKKAIDGLVALLYSDDSKARSSAARALGHQTNLLKESIDGLLALLEENDSKVQNAAAKVFRLLEEKDSKARNAAARLFGRQRNLPKEAIDGLVALLKASEVLEARDLAAELLGRQTNLPKEAINSLLALLKENDLRARDTAATALGQQTNLPKEAINSLVALLEENDSKARDNAATALGWQKNLPKEAIDGLVACLEESRSSSWNAAARALGRQTNLPQEKVECLIGLLASRPEEARQALGGQSTGQLFRLLPTLKYSLQMSLYSNCLVYRSFHDRAALCLEGNRLFFYASSGLETVLLNDEAAFRQAILEAQKTVEMPSASWVKLVSSGLSDRGQRGDGTEGPRGRGRGEGSLKGAGKRRFWRKGSRKGGD